MKTKFVLMSTGVFLLLTAVSSPLTALAASYMPFFHSQNKGETVMRTGQMVYLFHSGTNDVKKSIHANDILMVYRITPSCEVREVGKIKIITHIGETYLRGEVVEGEIRPDDFAKKDNVSCLVISAGMCQR